MVFIVDMGYNLPCYGAVRAVSKLSTDRRDRQAVEFVRKNIKSVA